MFRENLIPLNLQMFAEDTGVGSGAVGDQNAAGAGQTTQSLQIDYAKIQQMLDGTLAAKEDTALKAYFKQQGLSQQEAEQAMAAFRAEKAKNQPDVGSLQSQLSSSQSALQQAQIQNAAIMAAMGLGVDAKTMPYLLKMADLSQVMGQDGKINEDTLKNALNKVLEDIPALKPQAQQTTGFQFGAAGGQASRSSVDDELDRIFGVKKKEG